MFEMQQAQFDCLLPLFDPNEPHSVWVFSTLEGRTLGKAYVDNVDKPVNCLLTLNFTNLTCLSDGIDQQWLSQAVAALRQTQEVILNWSPRIAARLQPPAHPEAEKPCFDFHDCRTTHLLPILEGYHLRTIDHDLFERCLWYDMILTAYGTVENFLTYWNCFKSNSGSVATARKLGFRTQRAYQWLYYSKFL